MNPFKKHFNFELFRHVLDPVQVRFLARSFVIPGNHLGQQSTGLRWPYGPVSYRVKTFFSFLPLQIPALDSGL